MSNVIENDVGNHTGNHTGNIVSNQEGDTSRLRAFRDKYNLTCNTRITEDLVRAIIELSPRSASSTITTTPTFSDCDSVNDTDYISTRDTYVQIDSERLEILEFLEKNIPTIIQYEIYKSITSDHNGVKCDRCGCRIHK